MNPLLQQFLSETRESLHVIADKLMQLERAPGDADLMNELFRPVHTLKGNSGLFDFPEMTHVLHASEDLMDAVRECRVTYSRELADRLLDAMDFVGVLCGQIEAGGGIDPDNIAEAARLSEALRGLIGGKVAEEVDKSDKSDLSDLSDTFPLAGIPEPVRMDAYRRARGGESLHWLTYSPLEECFFQGDDPLFQARHTPDLLWGEIVPRGAWPKLAELDTYRCMLDFRLLSAAPREELAEYYRYVPDQVSIVPGDPLLLVIPQGNPNGGPVYEDFVADALQYLEQGDLTTLRHAGQTMLELSNPALWLSSALRWLLLLLDNEPDNRAGIRTLIESIRTLTPPDWASASARPEDQTGTTNNDAALSGEEGEALERIFADQQLILALDDRPAWYAGRLKGVAAVLLNCCTALEEAGARQEIEAALATSLATNSGSPLSAWLAARKGVQPANSGLTAKIQPLQEQPQTSDFASPAQSAAATADDTPKFGRRAEDQAGAKNLKVDQAKIDLLMNLIGEMVVSKNALPYLAQRAENQYGAREVAREIKTQYAVINRIVEEMQGAIMQVRMMPVSFVFQRFPRLVRDISRKLGKEVHLALEGEETEADKNIIESLADPLIHIVRNSLDHGLETPEVRQACGKPAVGTLTIRARQEADRVLIEIIDDGKGIDPEVVKRKAYEKGVIDETTLERISDRDAVNLVFAAGFSTAETISDLSGRGVGMDVVRSGVERVDGVILLESEVGKGTCIRISLPLSMAVTKVMIIESDGQLFGVPMDHVVETVRIHRSAIQAIKRSQTTVLRGRIVPLKTLNSLLGIYAEPKANADDAMAILVARIGSESVGLIVDDFHETVDVIQKPLDGVLSGLAAYSGSALMGDGSVLMVLNLKEIV